MTRRCRSCDERFPLFELYDGKFCSGCVSKIVEEFKTLLTDNFTRDELTVINDCLDCSTCRIEEVHVQKENRLRGL